MQHDSLVPREWFGKASMQRINVLSIERISAEDRAKIEAVDPAIELTDAGGWYDGEIRETWPAFTTARYSTPGQWTPETTRLFDEDRFAAIKAGGVLINVARCAAICRSRSPGR